MDGRRYRIEYGSVAQRDLDFLPDRIRKQICEKSSVWKPACMAMLSGYVEQMTPIDYGWAIIESCLTLKETLS
jgi:hypothetical protein